jgi:hypothetical protein
VFQQSRPREMIDAGDGSAGVVQRRGDMEGCDFARRIA